MIFESTSAHYLLTRYNNARVVPITKDAPGFGPHAGEHLAVDALHGGKCGFQGFLSSYLCVLDHFAELRLIWLESECDGLGSGSGCLLWC